MTTTAIINAQLLDPERGTITDGAYIVTEDDRILEVGEGTASADRVIDAKGQTLMPGLIDAHVHAFLTSMDMSALAGRPMTLHALEASKVLEGMLQRGFTTVRDAAGADWGLAAAVERGLIKGPRIYFSGRSISQTGGHGDPRSVTEDPPICACGANSSWLSHIVDGVDAVRTAVRTELRRGANQIKLMASGGVASPTDPLMSLQMSPEEMKVASNEAKDWGTYTMAHAYSPDAIRRAVEAGVRSIEHGNLIDEDVANLMAKNNAFIVPTLVTYHTLHELGREAGFPEVSLNKLEAVLEAGVASLEIAKKAGVPIGYGTDLLGHAHAQQCREFTIRAEVLTPLEIIQSATLTNATLLNASDDIGALKVGAKADMILLQRNPLDDISVLADPEAHLALVMKDGRIEREVDFQ
jgi:imidazolonepropionase-like amidohydrolase